MPNHTRNPSFDLKNFLTQTAGLAAEVYQKDHIIYSQGEWADSIFYIYSGSVKVTVFSKHGKEAVLAFRGPDEFFGEGAMTGKPVRLATATAASRCEIIPIGKEVIVRLLHQELAFADYFLEHLLTRTVRLEADLVDQLFNSTEMRLARALVLLAHLEGDLNPEPISINVNQETLAAMIGTTRARVSIFMNKFRTLGLIHYNGHITVHKALLNFVLRERS